MRALLVDDHNLFRQGLIYILSDLDDSISFMEAESCNAALDMLAEHEVDLVLLDYYMPGLNGIDSLKLVKAAAGAATIVMLSGDDNPLTVRNAIDHGAAGFIPKSSTSDVLIAALKLILAGGTYLPPTTLGGGLSPQAASQADILDKLSQRQRESFLRAIQGKSNKVIAKELELSEGTVKAHLSAAFRSLGIQNRTEAVYLAAKAGLTGT